MSAIGYIQVIAYTSRAKIPVENTAVTVVSDDGRLLGLRITDSSGKTTPITLEVPDRAESQSPDPGITPTPPSISTPGRRITPRSWSGRFRSSPEP